MIKDTKGRSIDDNWGRTKDIETGAYFFTAPLTAGFVVYPAFLVLFRSILDM